MHGREPSRSAPGVNRLCKVMPRFINRHRQTDRQTGNSAKNPFRNSEQKSEIIVYFPGFYALVSWTVHPGSVCQQATMTMILIFLFLGWILEDNNNDRASEASGDEPFSCPLTSLTDLEMMVREQRRQQADDSIQNQLGAMALCRG